MREGGAPLGEARRLRYFVVLSKTLMRFPSIDMDLFIERLIKSVSEINPDLNNYTRHTGILQSNAVARNYIRFADWLGFIKIENKIVTPSSYTILLANLGEYKDFNLTQKEKIAFFLRLIDLPDVKKLLGILRIRNSIKSSIDALGLSEHFIESYYEWFVDLGLLRPTKAKFGMFELTNLGYQIHEAVTGSKDVTTRYVEQIIEKPVHCLEDLSDSQIWDTLEKSLHSIGKQVHSDIDPRLYAAFPLILDVQVRIIIDYQMVISIADLIKKLKDISPKYNASFSWDNVTDLGYLKLMR